MIANAFQSPSLKSKYFHQQDQVNICKLFIYLHDESFRVARVVQFVRAVSWSGWSCWSCGLGGLGGPGGPGGPGCQCGPGGQGCLGG